MLHKLTANAIAGVEKKRIKTSELKLGMFVAALDRPWIDSPYLVHGFVLKSESQLTQLRELCRTVTIDISRSDFTRHSSFQKASINTTSYETQKSFLDNIESSASSYGEAKHTVEEMFDSLRQGGTLNTKSMQSSVISCVDNIVDNPDSMLWLSMIKNKDEYTAQHSLNVALLAVVLGRALGLNREDLELLGFCAMLHDIGKVKIPDDILNKEGNLNDEEFAVMKMHTVHGKKILLGQSNIPDIALEIAFSHHEKMDGTGYPNGLTAEKIPYFVKIVAIVDAYDAITSGRIYCNARPPAEAMRLLIKSKGQHHDAELVEKFVECVGIYPLGALAQLNTDEFGFVIPGSDANKLQPKILVISDSEQQPCEPHIVDLSRDRRKDNNRAYMIRALHEDGKFGFSFAAYHEQALRFVSD